MNDAQYMRKALTYGSETNPNIFGKHVGVVIVNDGIIVSYGRKEFAGDFLGESPFGNALLHAERVGIIRGTAGGEDRVRGSTLYTTLEPCHRSDEGDCTADGLLDDCSKLIADSGISRVVIGSIDRNAEVNGAGMAYLYEHGVEVRLLPGFEDKASSLHMNRWKYWMEETRRREMRYRSSDREIEIRQRRTLRNRIAELVSDEKIKEFWG